MHPDHELNRASWDELAAAHGQDAYYDSKALVAGASSLIDEEEAALATVARTGLADRRVLHVQCHLGFDSITLARRGPASRASISRPSRSPGRDRSPIAAG